MFGLNCLSEVCPGICIVYVPVDLLDLAALLAFYVNIGWAKATSYSIYRNVTRRDMHSSSSSYVGLSQCCRIVYQCNKIRVLSWEVSKGMLGKVYLYPGNFLRSYITYLTLR